MPEIEKWAALRSIRNAVVTYLDLLGEGRVVAAADDAMAPLAGVNLHGMQADELKAVRENADQARLVNAAALAAAPSTPTADRPEVRAWRSLTYQSMATYAPSAATAATAWLIFSRGQGDQLVAAEAEGSPRPLGPSGTTVLRHVVAAGGADPWVVASVRDKTRWKIRAHSLRDGHDEDATPDADHAVNPEATVTSEGDLHMVHQQSAGGYFVIAHRVRSAKGGWYGPTILSPSDESAWDPCVVTINDGVAVVWTVHRAGRFRLVMRRLERGKWGPELNVPLGVDGHALHPTMTADADGAIWIACDVLQADGLAASGRTAYVPTASLGAVDPPSLLPAYSLVSRLEVVRWDSGGWSRPAGEAVVERSAGTYPRLAVDTLGRLWLGYRSMRQLPFRHYLAHVAVRLHTGDAWSEPTLLPHSDGTNAEFSLRNEGDHVAVVYHGDDHEARYRQLLQSALDGTEEFTETNESLRREHLAMPAMDRMATGGHLGFGTVVETVVAAEGGRPPATVATGDAQHRADIRRVSPEGWAPPSGGEDPYRLYWGDLHRHSNISRCGAGLDLGTDDHFRLAEDVLGCDFWALTDHAENTSDLNWHHLKKLANGFYREGQHVPMIGFEWTSFNAGHMNVIYSGDDGPILSSSDPETSTPEGLWAALDGHEVLTIPHHPAALVYATDWSYRSEDYLRVVEIFQAATGSYESPWSPRLYHDAVAPGATVQEALSAGHKLGFIASTDHRNGSAFLGVYAQRLDRESIHEALRERRCFAATRRGIVPHLRLGSGWQGGSVPANEVADIEFGAAGIGPLSIVELIRDGEVVANSRLIRCNDASALQVGIDIRMRSEQGGPRVWDGALKVEGQASLAPVAFVPPAVTAVEATGMSWAFALPERYGGRPQAPGVTTLGATVIGPPDSIVVVEAGPCELTFTLADLADGTPLTDIRDGGELAVRAGTGGLTNMGTSTWVSTANPELVRAGSWYYVRAIQVDGEMAWSSPVWVE